jgi:hypothetical protein
MNDHELESEIFALLDGELDAARVKRLEARLLGDPLAREAYRSCTYFHSALSTRVRGGDRVEGWSIIPHDKIVAMQRRRSVSFSLAAAVALLLVVGSLLWLRISHGDESRGYAFQVTPGSQFSLTHPGGREDHEPDELLPGSRMRMSEGNIECMLEHGVRMLVEAPFDLTLQADGDVQLDEGTAWFHVPEQGRGFRVATRELEVVDLGTEFGVDSSPFRDDEVHVFQGRVSVTSLNPLRGDILLRAGEAVSTDAAGRLHPLPPDRSLFLVTLPPQLKEPAVYHIRSRWIGERYLTVDGSRMATGSVKGDNGRWIFRKRGASYLIQNPDLKVYLALDDSSETVVPVKSEPSGDRGRWLVEPTGDGFAFVNKATGRYLNIEDLGKPPAANLARPPSQQRWTSGLWNLIQVGGGEAEEFESR